MNGRIGRRADSRRLRMAAFVSAAGLVVSTVLTVPALVAAAGTTTVAADNSATKYFGAFRETGPVSIPDGTVSRYGVTPASVMWFDSWASGKDFNAAAVKALWDQGIMSHYTWEPWDLTLSVSDPDQIHLQDIIDGEWDSYIKDRGAEFAAVGVPIMVRWGHEFNGNWYPWGIANNGGDPALYVDAYRRVHDLVVAAGATNVQWIWCSNNIPTPAAAYNDPALSYPGDAYVDWVAIDGYNWGLGPSWDPVGDYWTSFDSLFATVYAKARAIAPHRPVMLGEFGSSEDGGDKAQWINEMDAALQSGKYPDLKMVVYFDHDKEELWSGTSSPTVQTAFTSWVNQPYMKGNGTDLALVAEQYKQSTTPTTTPPVTPTTTPPSEACSAVYKTAGSWTGGYQGEVTVRAGSSAISGWTVGLTLPGGQTIDQLWNGTARATGASVTVQNMSWNGSVSATGSATFGFTTNGSPSTVEVTCTAT